jgi:hypothetical protein
VLANAYDSAMRFRSLAASLLPSLLVLSPACTSHPPDGFGQWAWLGVEPSSEPEAVSAFCSPSSVGVRTQMRADGTAGELTLRLLDPAGVERHRAVVRAGHCEVVQHWPVQVGEWTLRAEPDRFTGSYSIQVSAGSDPDPVIVEIAGNTRP